MSRSKFMSRRFGMTLGCLLLFTGLLISEDINQDTYQTLVISIIGGYLMSSYSEKRIPRND